MEYLLSNGTKLNKNIIRNKFDIKKRLDSFLEKSSRLEGGKIFVNNGDRPKTIDYKYDNSKFLPKSMFSKTHGGVYILEEDVNVINSFLLNEFQKSWIDNLINFDLSKIFRKYLKVNDKVDRLKSLTLSSLVYQVKISDYEKPINDGNVFMIFNLFSRLCDLLYEITNHKNKHNLEERQILKIESKIFKNKEFDLNANLFYLLNQGKKISKTQFGNDFRNLDHIRDLFTHFINHKFSNDSDDRNILINYKCNMDKLYLLICKISREETFFIIILDIPEITSKIESVINKLIELSEI